VSLFNFSEPELLTFFAVLVRFSVLVAVLPFIGDKMIPMTAKVLFALATTIALFPALVTTGQVKPGDALIWGRSAGGIAGVVALEALVALVLGYTARLLFDAISLGANLAGNFMGFAAASTYDPHQETQTQVIAEIQLAVAMLMFLAVDGHHLMLQSALDSYRIVGLGQADIGATLSQRLIEFSGQVIRFGIQLTAPVAISLFAVNIAFGVIAKAMPQLNILVLSFSVTALVGLLVMFISVPEFASTSSNLLGRMGDWMSTSLLAMSTR
jgi:flagellar biosynthesis protein FliR